MTTTAATVAFNRLTDPVFKLLPIDVAQNVVRYRGDPELHERLEELSQKSNEGTLTSQETEEFEGYVRANKFVAILQAKARNVLAQSGES